MSEIDNEDNMNVGGMGEPKYPRSVEEMQNLTRGGSSTSRADTSISSEIEREVESKFAAIRGNSIPGRASSARASSTMGASRGPQASTRSGASAASAVSASSSMRAGRDPQTSSTMGGASTSRIGVSIMELEDSIDEFQDFMKTFAKVICNCDQLFTDQLGALKARIKIAQAKIMDLEKTRGTTHGTSPVQSNEQER